MSKRSNDQIEQEPALTAPLGRRKPGAIGALYSVLQHWPAPHTAAVVMLVTVAVWAGCRAWIDIFYLAATDEEASQVWLVFPVFAWLVWVRQKQLAEIKPRFSLLGPAIIAVGWAVSMVGYYNSKAALEHGGAVLVLVGAFATVAGPGIMRRMLPALVVLGFLVPVPASIRQEIAIPMQTYTASASEFCFTLLTLDVARSGNVLTYNGQDVAVAEACNGMRMIFALLLVTYAFAFATPLRPSVRALVLVLSPVAAIGCNVLRLVPTVYLYGQSPDQWGPLFHDFSGWAMLALAFGLLMGTVKLLQWAEVPVMQLRPQNIATVPA